MPGRLEFEHELDNDAEVAVKDMEFGLVWKYGGDEQPAAKPTVAPEEGDEQEGEEGEEDEDNEGDEGDGDQDAVKGERPKGEDKPKVKTEKRDDADDDDDVHVKQEPDTEPPDPSQASATADSKRGVSSSPNSKKKDKGKKKAEPAGVVVEVEEDEDELEVKLAMLDIYFSKLDKRENAKEIIFDRKLTDHKRVRDVFSGSAAGGAVLSSFAHRYRPMSDGGRKTNESSSSGTRCLPNCRPPRTMRYSWKA